MKRILLIVISSMLSMWLTTQAVLADGIIIPEPPICRSCPIPPPTARDVPYLTVENHRVHVTIENQIATTRVDQVFRNDSQWSLEGTYIFPLPENAAISDFTMWIDGEPIAGKLYTKEEARRIYDEIVRRRLDPALLEYVGRDLFQASIFPIDPGDSRRIELEYTQILPLDNGLVEYLYPLSTEKFSAKPLEQVAITVELTSTQPIKTLYSASHPVTIDRDGRTHALVGWEDANVLPDTDFSLYYTISSEDIGLNLLSFKQPDEDGFFTMFIAPNVDAGQDEIIAKDLLLVLDTSGSMEGEKMEQARSALTYVLDHLNPEDRFNITTFSTGVRSFGSRLQSTATLSEARRFVDRLEPGGSTDINRALLEAISMADTDRPTIIIFLTDGLPTSGVVETPLILNNITQTAPDNIRIFPFGVGDDVDTLLLDGLAETMRGTTAYVRPGERIDEQVSGFYNKISTPILADLTLEVSDNVIIGDTYPDPLPDLFAGTQLILTGRYRDGGMAVITLTGQINGEPRTYRYEDNLFEADAHIALTQPAPPTQKSDFIPRLWATRKIGHLLKQIRLYGENREAVSEIVELSTRYGIITPYTSFLVEEPGLALREESRSNMVDDMMESPAAEAPTFGAEAVDQAVAQKSMVEAEMAAPVGGQSSMDKDGTITITEAAIKVVGERTFLMQDGVWTDTQFDPATMTVTQLRFPSDELLKFLYQQPEAGRYFALGPRVLVVIEGIAYETIAE